MTNTDPFVSRDKITVCDRYHRHHILPEIGLSGQEILAKKCVAVVGIGGLGSPACLYLAASGVGRLVLVDPDRVESSNLQRQIIHGVPSLGRDKTASGAEKIRELNPHVRVSVYNTRLCDANAEQILRDCDLVMGCVDSIEARYCINTACVRLKIANVYGSADHFDGQIGVFPPGGKPCYRCFFREPPERSGSEAVGVFSPLPGVIGALQAAEALKLLLGMGRPLIGGLLLADLKNQTFREIAVKPDPGCPICGASSL